MTDVKNTPECRDARHKAGLTVCPLCDDTGSVTRTRSGPRGTYGFRMWRESCSACTIFGNPNIEGMDGLDPDVDDKLGQGLRELFGV